jgi:hypothetical protein
MISDAEFTKADSFRKQAAVAWKYLRPFDPETGTRFSFDIIGEILGRVPGRTVQQQLQKAWRSTRPGLGRPTILFDRAEAALKAVIEERFWEQKPISCIEVLDMLMAV